MINKQRGFPGGIWPEANKAMLKAGPKDVGKLIIYTRHVRQTIPALVLALSPDYRALVDKCKQLALESRKPVAIYDVFIDFVKFEDTDWLDKAGKVLLEGPRQKYGVIGQDLDDDWLFFVAMFAKLAKNGVWDEGADVIWRWASPEMVESYLGGDFFEEDEYRKRVEKAQEMAQEMAIEEAERLKNKDDRFQTRIS